MSCLLKLHTQNLCTLKLLHIQLFSIITEVNITSLHFSTVLRHKHHRLIYSVLRIGYICYHHNIRTFHRGKSGVVGHFKQLDIIAQEEFHAQGIFILTKILYVNIFFLYSILWFCKNYNVTEIVPSIAHWNFWKSPL